MTTYKINLTVEEVLAEARRRGVKEFADWIEAEQARRQAAFDAKVNAPITTPGGVIEVGKWYDVTATKLGKTRNYKRVTLDRRGAFGAPRLVYGSRATAQYMYEGDVAKITSVKEVD